MGRFMSAHVCAFGDCAGAWLGLGGCGGRWMTCLIKGGRRLAEPTTEKGIEPAPLTRRAPKLGLQKESNCSRKRGDA